MADSIDNEIAEMLDLLSQANREMHPEAEIRHLEEHARALIQAQAQANQLAGISPWFRGIGQGISGGDTAAAQQQQFQSGAAMALQQAQAQQEALYQQRFQREYTTQWTPNDFRSDIEVEVRAGSILPRKGYKAFKKPEIKKEEPIKLVPRIDSLILEEEDE